MNKQTFTVFVYGTLMSGGGNHSVMTASHGKLLGKGAVYGFLFSNGIYPYLCTTGKNYKAAPYRVFGEWWKVSNMSMLDALEGYSPECLFAPHYIRAWTAGVMLDTDELPSDTIEGFSYVYPYNPSPEWEELTDGRFVERPFTHAWEGGEEETKLGNLLDRIFDPDLDVDELLQSTDIDSLSVEELDILYNRIFGADILCTDSDVV